MKIVNDEDVGYGDKNQGREEEFFCNYCEVGEWVVDFFVYDINFKVKKSNDQ